MTVEGHGTATAVPDAIRITGEFEGLCGRYEEAMEQAVEAAVPLRDALGEAGFDPKILKTSRLDIRPEYVSGEDGSMTFRGYSYRHGISVTADSDGMTVGRLMEAILDSGSAPRIRTEYFCRDVSGPMSQARRNAVDDAKSKAEELADAAGVRLGDIESISYASGHGPAVMMARSMKSVSAEFIAEPEDQTFSDSVNIVWEIL